MKLITKELEISRSAQSESTKHVNNLESKQKDVEKQLKKSNWNIKDVTAMKDAR